MLKRRQVPTVKELTQPARTTGKPFRDYEPGFVHVDIKYLPQMPDETERRYLFVAIDRATRWVYLEVRKSQSAKEAQGFLQNLTAKAPFHS